MMNTKWLAIALALAPSTTVLAWPAAGYWNFTGSVIQQTCSQDQWAFDPTQATVHIYSDSTRDATCPWRKTGSTVTRCTIPLNYPSPFAQCQTITSSLDDYIVCAFDSPSSTSFYEAHLSKNLYNKPAGAQNWFRGTSFFKTGPLAGRSCQRTGGGAQAAWKAY